MAPFLPEQRHAYPESRHLVPLSFLPHVGDPLVKGGAIEVSREQLQTFFLNGGFGGMEVYAP